MTVSFHSPAQAELFDLTVGELQQLGYRDHLLEKGYLYPDYFEDDTPEREIPVATFGQTPPSYQTACFGVLVSEENGPEGVSLVERHRALGAPLHLEVRRDRVIVWAVGLTRQTTKLRGEYSRKELRSAFANRADVWSPESMLRSKNIGDPRQERQLDFFDAGLIPALEEQIEQKLDPILKDALAAAKKAYRKSADRAPDEREFFRLAFRLLAGKIFHDRGILGFRSLTTDSGPDAVLQKVADHYRESVPRLLNLPTRQAAFERIWSGLDFRNLSIDVLTAIWSKTLVTKAVRKALGIHTTPRTVAAYIVNNLPSDGFEGLKEAKQQIVEPCCGSATFLVEAMQRVREGLPSDFTPKKRHAYFRDVLEGFEVETFGVEIARLCLALADFPNPNGWRINEHNIFTSTRFPDALAAARVVLCNPPFQTMAPDDPLRAHVESFHKPAEILRRTLLHLDPTGVIGFVLPRTFLDGASYRTLRRELVTRFANLELVSLPDVAFRESAAQSESVLLLATFPRQGGTESAVCHRRVDSADWEQFRKLHRPTSEDWATKTADEASTSLAVPRLAEVWRYLAGLPKLAKSAKFSKGIDWNRPLVMNGKETGYRSDFVHDTPHPSWTRQGVPPRVKISCFERPETKHLSIRPEDQRRNAFRKPWHLPKVILNASRRSRGPWRISAFADFDGLTCYRTFLAVWPNDPALVKSLTAILNGPVANAFAASREGRNIRLGALKAIPMPALSVSLRNQLDAAVDEYTSLVEQEDWAGADAALRRVDALTLNAYGLPPRLERALLDYFNGFGGKRRVPIDIDFSDYFPKDFTPTIPLSMYLSPKFRKSTARNLSEAAPRITDPELVEALEEVE